MLKENKGVEKAIYCLPVLSTTISEEFTFFHYGYISLM